MKIYCEEKIRSRVMDGMAPILIGLEKFLPLFREPEVFAASGAQARVTLISRSASIDLDTAEAISLVVRGKKASAWFCAVGELQLVIQKDLE